MDADPDPETRAELARLLEAGDAGPLAERFAGELAFGTAGLRARLGAGPSRMNRAVVIRVTRALGEVLLARVPDARSLGVVVGHDARRGSPELARDACSVLLALGFSVRRFPEAVPTPLVGYAVKQLGAAAGVVITASHNPPEYNGFKVYGPEGIQLVPPWDQEVSARLAGVPAAIDVPRREEPPEEVPPLEERYLHELLALRPAGSADRDFDIVFTPLHGVGGALTLKALARAGFSKVHPVAEQLEPDGRFPTVRFPNPEEPGALDRALALAGERHADLLLAQDPDADRLAVAVPTAAGRWIQLTGNQVGLLLGDFLLAGSPRAPGRLCVSSLVSTPLFGVVAEAHGARWEQTLTGFKWIWTAARTLERDHACRFVFGFEEALGYSAGGLVRDKDGVAAAVLFAELAAQARARGKTVLEALDDLYLRHGVEASAQRSLALEGPGAAARMRAALERWFAHLPGSLGGRRVAGAADFRQGAAARPPWLGAADLFSLELERGGRVLVRPSGTEPKVKIYVDLVGPAPAAEALHATRDALAEEAGALADEVAAALRGASGVPS